MKLLSRLFSILLIIGIISACGMHLRSYNHLPPEVKSIYIKTTYPYDPFNRQLRSALSSLNIPILDEPKNATLILTILSEQKDQPMTTVASSQQIRQYNLIFTTSFQLENAKGQIVYGPKTISAQRSQTIRPSEILSDNNETANLYEILYRETVNNLLSIITSTDARVAIKKDLRKKPKVVKKLAPPAVKPATPAILKKTEPPIPSTPITPSDLPTKTLQAPVSAQAAPDDTALNATQ